MLVELLPESTGHPTSHDHVQEPIRGHETENTVGNTLADIENHQTAFILKTFFFFFFLQSFDNEIYLKIRLVDHLIGRSQFHIGISAMAQSCDERSLNIDDMVAFYSNG